MKRATLIIDRDSLDVHPLHEAVVDGSAVSRAEVLLWDDGRQTPTTLSWCDGPESAVDDLLDGLSIVEDYTLSPAQEGTYAFVWQEQLHPAPGVMSVLSDPAVLTLPPISYRADGSIALRLVGTHAALGDLVSRLSVDMSYSVTELTEYRGTGHAARLTTRQRDALRAAVEVGYYDVPRTGTMTEIAAELDCAESTASELVRKAQATVVRASIRETAPEPYDGRC
ncbi:MAG: helix-turn-helix domain-containing protein [Halorientalis sp.]